MIAGLIFIVLTIICIGVLGKYGTQRYNQPILVVARVAEAGFKDSKGRIDGILIIGYITFLIGACAYNLYAAALFTKKMFPKLPYKMILLSLLSLSLVFSFSYSNQEAFFTITVFKRNIGVITALLIPILLYLISKMGKVKA